MPKVATADLLGCNVVAEKQETGGFYLNMLVMEALSITNRHEPSITLNTAPLPASRTRSTRFPFQ